MLAERLVSCVVGGLSNLGATMGVPGIYEQRNAGHLLIGELAGGESERTERESGSGTVLPRLFRSLRPDSVSAVLIVDGRGAQL